MLHLIFPTNELGLVDQFFFNNVFILFLISAGVGRTGVFITLSIVLERMQYEGVVDVFQSVRALRTQRPAMVQVKKKEKKSFNLWISVSQPLSL